MCVWADMIDTGASAQWEGQVEGWFTEVGTLAVGRAVLERGFYSARWIIILTYLLHAAESLRS